MFTKINADVNTNVFFLTATMGKMLFDSGGKGRFVSKLIPVGSVILHPREIKCLLAYHFIIIAPRSKKLLFKFQQAGINKVDIYKYCCSIGMHQIKDIIYELEVYFASSKIR